MNDPQRAWDQVPDLEYAKDDKDVPLDVSGQGMSEAAANFNFDPPATAIVVPFQRLPTTPVGAIDKATVARSDQALKRTIDLVGATLLLLVFALPMAVFALALSFGGPVLFTQTRVGRGRVRFTCLKFRTMHVDAEERLASVLANDERARAEWQVHQKLTNDPRVTRIGSLLRRSSLDELPQLFNVLRGQMSLVGPRPIVAPELKGYPADRRYFDSPAFDAYATCLPGLTGLWQVVGRHRAAHADRVALDGIYARERTTAMDLKILWRTIGVVLSGSGR